MAIVIDQAVHDAIGRRRARCRDGAIRLYVGTPRCLPEMLLVRWGSPRAKDHRLVARTVDGVVLYLGSRVAAYAACHDLVLTAWRLGPATRLEVADAMRAILALHEWEQRSLAS